jgi:tetratricopeptide (TPR) repeat protein
MALRPSVAIAQAVDPVVRDEFLSDPERTEPRDPLLPQLPVVRPLSPLEQRDLAIALDQLAREATALYEAGESDDAFDLWMREVRLRRILGYGPELAAIQRVGRRVWENSRTREAQLLTLRLDVIQAEILGSSAPTLALITDLAASYEVLRAVDDAIALYNTLLAATPEGDRRQILLLERVGQLQEEWFRFAAAAETYRQLLVLANSGASPQSQRLRYARRAVANYENAGELGTAINYQRLLVREYEARGEMEPVPSLLLAIARNYRDLGRADLALPFYKTAYRLALDLDQSLAARDVVADLAVLYETLDRPEDVQYLYEQQLAVERLSYSGYGIMTVFGQLGEFYETQEDWEAAIAAYREGLILAHHLNHRRAYFETRIRHIQIQQGTLTIDPVDDHLRDTPSGSLISPSTWQGNGG